MEIKQYTKELIPDVLQFERDLRVEENFWGWEIDEKYIADVTARWWAELIPQRYTATLTVRPRHT